MKDRLSLEKYLKDKSYNIIIDQKKCKQFYDLCKSKFNLPRGISADFISFRKDFSEANDFVLYILLSSYLSVYDSKDNRKKFFTNQEIEKYSTFKYEEETIKFPIVFDMIQNSEDQWIGCISTKELMLLRKAQLINYEENTQRTKRRITRGENVYYEISLNKRAIKEITSSLENGRYIADDLTLNIPFNSSADFTYNKEQKRLIIKSIKAFDIIDGYHRYIAICRASDANPDFNYNMELRITNFDEEKARNFIYQKDQKTKMSKIDSDTYNMNSIANIIVTRLNDSSQCNIKGMINRNNGYINFSDLATSIKYYYIPRDLPKSQERKFIVQTVAELTEDFNILTEYDYSYLEKTYSFKDIVSIIHVFKKYQDKDKTNMCKTIDIVCQKMQDIQGVKYNSRTMKKSIERDIEAILSE